MVDNDILSRNEYFRPEDNISKSEALIMLIRSIGFDFMINDVSNWQQEIVNYANEKGVINKFYDYNTLATRGWIFEIADKAIKIKEKEKGIRELELGKPDDITEDNFNIIRTKCSTEWPTDFSMRKFCEDGQYKGIRELR